MTVLSLVALVGDSQQRPVLEALGSRRLVIDHELAPLDAQRVEPDGCIFEVARSAALTGTLAEHGIPQPCGASHAVGLVYASS